MTTGISMIDKVYEPLIRNQKLKIGLLEGKMTDIQNRIGTSVMDTVAIGIEITALQNMQSYALSGTTRRNKTIEDAFKILEDVVGFQWNQNGSYTKNGAFDRFNEDVTITHGVKRMSVKVEGRLEDMEKGKLNWGSLRSFFYSQNVKSAIFHSYKGAAIFYIQLKKLFATEKGDKRPYVSQAVQKGADAMDFGIRKAIDDAFSGRGRWQKK